MTDYGTLASCGSLTPALRDQEPRCQASSHHAVSERSDRVGDLAGPFELGELFYFCRAASSTRTLSKRVVCAA